MQAQVQKARGLQPQGPKPKAVQMPTPIPPPTIPLDESAWQNGVLLVDKPQVGEMTLYNP